jgi:uncharacterized membrane protein YphA (DoxX/SURF4 family)
MSHFFALSLTADMVPSWIPPSQKFWAAATGVFHILAGVAIVSGVLDSLASRLFTAMILSFGALVHLPHLIAQPNKHMVWAGNAVNLAIAGAAWVVADSIPTSKRQGPWPAGGQTSTTATHDSLLH